MKKINKKVLVIVGIILVLFLLVLCCFKLFGGPKTDPKGMTEDFMKKYVKADKNLLKDIKYPFDEELSENQLARYKEIVKDNYKDMRYEINVDSSSETDAIITVKFTVRDLRSAYDQASSYISLYPNEFDDGGKFDSSAANDYIIKTMGSTNDTVDYAITFSYYKNNNEWVMSQLSKADYKKLDGTF